MKKLLLLGTAVLMGTTVQAGGFQLSEYSTTSIGRAFAGAGVVGDDFSAIAFNPAGMALNKSGFQVGASLVSMIGNVKGSVDNGTVGKKGKVRSHNVVPYAFGQYALNKKMRVGVGVYVPYAFSLEYNDGWFGRGHGKKSEIKTITYALAFSYNIAPCLTIGAGVQAQTLDARLTNDVDASTPYNLGYNSDMKGDGFNVTGNIGIMYQPRKNTRFGVSYQMKSNHNLKGDHHVYAGIDQIPARDWYGDIHAKLVLPEYLLISGYHKMDKWGFSASAKWTRWSQFDTLDIYSNYTGTDMPVGAVHENWKNTWTLSAGVDYDWSDKTTLRAGLAYDQTGIKGAEFRTARLPDSDRWIASVGASYQMTKNMSLDMAYAHMFMKKGNSAHKQPNGGSRLDAKYDSQINIFSVGFQYKF